MLDAADLFDMIMNNIYVFHDSKTTALEPLEFFGQKKCSKTQAFDMNNPPKMWTVCFESRQDVFPKYDLGRLWYE